MPFVGLVIFLYENSVPRKDRLRNDEAVAFLDKLQREPNLVLAADNFRWNPCSTDMEQGYGYQQRHGISYKWGHGHGREHDSFS